MILLNYYCYMFFIPMLMISSMLIFISNSWFSMWMIMEINLISFICMLIFDKNIKNELMMSYFLVQSFNSYIFILSFIMMLTKMKLLFLLMMYMSIISKIGLPPFYLWYIKIMKNLNWMNLFLLSTIQKLIPLIILNNIIMYKYLIYLYMYMILISFYSSIKGLNYNNLKIILTYSSIIQISWMILLMISSEMMMMNYFMIYLFINLNLILNFYKFNINNLNNLMNMKFNKKNHFYLIMLMMFSLSSIPPMYGFLMKLISIEFMNLYMNFYLILMMIFNSLISMYFYTKIIFISLMNYSMMNKFNFKLINYYNNYNLKLSFYSMLMFLMLMMYELL
uniref:NADH-ubiquinone oxidoreductase chain 2 n=1 Tax=Encarsia formosa TaxID=32400 RepID=A0A386T8I9_ENCFO|nr:NADH dehydrogenase subunit 2 [Encarsia formosa]